MLFDKLFDQLLAVNRHFVDLAAFHVVQFAVVPDQLNVVKNFLEGRVFVIFYVFLKKLIYDNLRL